MKEIFFKIIWIRSDVVVNTSSERLIDFLVVGTNPNFIRVLPTKGDLYFACVLLYSMPNPSSKKRAIFIACALKDRVTFVEINDALVKPNGKTRKTK